MGLPGVPGLESMRRFFIDPQLLTEEQIRLPEEILRHLRVLRLQPGMEIELLDGAGLSCSCELLELDRRRGLARVKKRHRVSENTLPLTLLQGLPKGDKFDLVLQKGTELGISRFVPTLCERCQPSGRPRLPRWQRIIREAARQSGRMLLPELAEPLPLGDALNRCRSELRLVPWEQDTTPLQAVLPSTAPRDAAILIGPEGGLSAAEVEMAQQQGFIPVSLGSRILRTETAGFAVAGILQYLYGDLGTNRERSTGDSDSSLNRPRKGRGL
ncbi:16S rRNA (uracil(1498)-N(3))-methyltransferase [Geothermobacter hydrogeniphilus]|uniref:Ribosomal RNA small subunit methyltransferase E n=1 Tax=Geothermobacter hydrogeniphilus TaxID=1969733 RepID=A0A1X0Y840_9BACT|nr:16S rRNA (uracil(1498)-N(3))-methyltransferase [Geothermobacter hydrogeniphilus]ORJ61272.1 16S rRNA (uracil(1498)-N(3))-methyltransferase [Geothermobacter hydrogeniphilus]